MRTACAVALGMLLASAQAAAQKGLADPTRPPIMTLAPQVTSAAEALGPELQSVLISPARRIAVINGESVALGGKIGEATLVRVTESEAVLKQGSDMRVLKLYPSVEKTPSRPLAAKERKGAKGESQR